jgi:adenylate kinase
MNLLILGPQGSGKGTQAQRIAASYGLAHIATGDMLRQAMAAQTEFGRRVKPLYDAGQLVPDDLMIGLIRERLQQDHVEDGFILDGFPRTMAQADALDAMLREIDKPITAVLQLDVPDDVCVDRLSKRAREEGRVDDTPDAIRTRLDLYHRETEPVIEHYRAQGNLIVIHGDRAVNDVFDEIQQALEQAAVRQ